MKSPPSNPFPPATPRGAGDGAELISRLNAGEDAAFDELLVTNQDWVRRRVRERLGPALREKAESVDLVQATMAEVLRYRPSLRVESREQFRALMARIVENVIRGFHDHVRAQCRDAAREQRLASASMYAPSSGRETPPEACAKAERDQQVVAALARMRKDDRAVLELRHFHELQFAEIGERLGLTADAARMKCNRAEVRLSEILGSR